MSEQELIAENGKLKERIKELELLLQRKNGGSTRAYDEIRAMIISRVNDEVEVDIVNGEEKNWTRKIAEKQIMSDLKWDLRVRRVSDFRNEHIQQAKEYLSNYVMPEELKKSKWKNC